MADFAPGVCCAAADWCHHLVNSAERNIVGLVLLHWPHCVKTSSSTELQVHNILHCYRSRGHQQHVQKIL